MITWPDDPEPCAQPSAVVTVLAFTTGAVAAWFALVRPAFRWVTGTH